MLFLMIIGLREKLIFAIVFLVVVACFSLRRCGDEDGKNSRIHWNGSQFSYVRSFRKERKTKTMREGSGPKSDSQCDRKVVKK